MPPNQRISSTMHTCRRVLWWERPKGNGSLSKCCQIEVIRPPKFGRGQIHHAFYQPCVRNLLPPNRRGAARRTTALNSRSANDSPEGETLRFVDGRDCIEIEVAVTRSLDTDSFHSTGHVKHESIWKVTHIFIIVLAWHSFEVTI